MKNLCVFITIAFLLTLSVKSYSQMGVTSYSIYALGVNTSQNKMISGELKTFANRYIDDFVMELDVFFNFKPRTYHRFSVGLGLNAGLFGENDEKYSIIVPAQIEIYPLQEFKKLSILFELAAELGKREDSNIRHLWGIRYTFGQ